MTGLIVLFLRFLMVICLYGFLGWALFTIWRKLQSEGLLISNRKIPSIIFCLDQIEAQQFEFNIPEVIVGREATNDISLSDETVSARHARLSYHHNQWWVEDLNSTNGTFLNDEQLFTPTVVISGDDLRCGKVIMSLTIKS
jgi:pSer/pThr/pTyr-binding forkhead associated (FHA) protein